MANSKPPQTLLREAAARRAICHAGDPREAFRLLNGPGDGAPAGLALDRYARWLVLSVRDGVGDDVARSWADACRAETDAEGLVLKTLRRFSPEARPAPGPRSVPNASTNAVVWGTIPDTPVPVREEGAVFLVDLAKGLPTGLFLDQRDNRLRVRGLAKDQEVLNLFAYTCAFSVHAALGGAKRVTSVDASKAALARGRENMTASGLDPDRHRWFPDDAMEHLERAARRGQQYGVVIVDPPAFGRAGKRTFSVERDLERIADLAAQTLAPGGTLVLAVHTAGIGEERIRETARRALSAAGRSVHSLDITGLPADHPVVSTSSTFESTGSDRGDYLRTLVATAR